MSSTPLPPGLDWHAAVIPSAVPLTFSEEVDGKNQDSQQDAGDKS